MKVLFHAAAFADYQSWAADDLKAFKKISALIEEIARTPFAGTGKPEPLRGNLSGFWSRRITGERRLVYKVEQGALVVAACKYHCAKK